jgi:uncharacterized membrane protein YdfJ with MMPL/SSD domain
MAKQNVDPDALASKTFAVTILGAILYIAVVFIFVIANNAKTTGDPADQDPSDSPAAQAEGHSK